MDKQSAERITPAGFEIRVRGILSDRLLTAFPDLAAVPNDGDTVLTGGLPDQSALHGVLAQIEALGLELVEVRRRGGHHAAAGVPGTPIEGIEP